MTWEICYSCQWWKLQDISGTQLPLSNAGLRGPSWSIIIISSSPDLNMAKLFYAHSLIAGCGLLNVRSSVWILLWDWILWINSFHIESFWSIKISNCSIYQILCLTSLAHVYYCSGNARPTWTADIALVKLQSTVKAIAILTIHIFLKAHVG